MLGKVSHPRSVSWAFPPWAATIPRPTHAPFLFVCVYHLPGKKSALPWQGEIAVCNSHPAEFWQNLLALPSCSLHSSNFQSRRLRCLVLRSAGSQISGTHPSKLCLCPRPPSRMRWLVPSGVGSSPSGQHKMDDGQTGYSFAQGTHLLSTT